MMLLLTGQDMQQDDKHFLYVTTRGIFWATISRPGLKRVGWDTLSVSSVMIIIFLTWATLSQYLMWSNIFNVYHSPFSLAKDLKWIANIGEAGIIASLTSE